MRNVIDQVLVLVINKYIIYRDWLQVIREKWVKDYVKVCVLNDCKNDGNGEFKWEKDV